MIEKISIKKFFFIKLVSKILTTNQECNAKKIINVRKNKVNKTNPKIKLNKQKNYYKTVGGNNNKQHFLEF